MNRSIIFLLALRTVAVALAFLPQAQFFRQRAQSFLLFFFVVVIMVVVVISFCVAAALSASPPSPLLPPPGREVGPPVAHLVDGAHHVLVVTVLAYVA